jgi:hypothetical protein
MVLCKFSSIPMCMISMSSSLVCITGTATFSHLLYADNILIFCDASTAHLRYLRGLLLCFEATSSLKVNLAEAELIPVSNAIDVGRLARLLQCEVATLPGQVPWFTVGRPPTRPSTSGTASLRSWNIRMASWKMMHLSKGEQGYSHQEYPRQFAHALHVSLPSSGECC